jgi:hypothetical protein
MASPLGRLAVHQRAPRPTWLTPFLLKAARQGPVAAPAAAIADLPVTGLVGIRPGSMEIDPKGCTMNFVFQNAGALAIGTAGHCVDGVGQDVTLLTVDPDSMNPVLVDIGQVVYRDYAENRLAPDLAIVQIRPELYSWVFPTVAVVGGPCGAYGGDGLASVPVPQVFVGQEPAAEPEVLLHYGHGTGIGTGGTPRAGVALYWDADSFWWTSPSSPGDSGSPVVTHDMKAAGNLTDLVAYSDHPGAIVEGTRIQAFLRSGWSLVNSPYC